MKPTIPDVLPRFWLYHEVHPTWGSLHIVLDDYNTDNGSVQFCVKFAEEHGDAEGEALARILLTMSETQRRKLADKVEDADRAYMFALTGGPTDESIRAAEQSRMDVLRRISGPPA